MPFVSSRGANIYYEIHGTGPTVVFSHGRGGHTLFYYQQVPFFARSAANDPPVERPDAVRR